MVITQLDKKSVEILERDESKLIEALMIYYIRFGSNKPITFGGAAALAKANPAYVVDYMFYRGDIGMPETRDEARQYLKNLQKYLP